MLACRMTVSMHNLLRFMLFKELFNAAKLQ
jgi:hypothetical protein